MTKKVGSQQMFEETYLENQELFDEMSHSELVAETVNQLTSQGIDLQNLLCSAEDFEVDDENCFKYRILTLCSNFYEDLSEVNSSLLTNELKKNLAIRVYAAKSGCYKELVKLLEARNVLCLEPLVVILEKQPDLVLQEDMNLFINILKFCSAETTSEWARAENVRSVLTICINTCTLHEENRQNMLQKGAPEAILECLESHPDVFWQATAALRTYVLDDDIRVPFGKAHEHGQHIVGSLEAIPRLINTYKNTSKDINCNIALLVTLAKFCIRNEYCQQVVDNGAFQIATETFATEQGGSNERFVSAFLGFLKAAGGNDDVKDRIADSGCLVQLVQLLDTFAHSENVCEQALVTMSVVVLRKPQYSKLVFSRNFAELVVSTLDLHSSSKRVMKAAFLAIRALVNRNDEGKQLLIAKGVEQYLQQGSEIEELRENANDTLRIIASDKTVLQEPWTGHQGDRISRED